MSRHLYVPDATTRRMCPPCEVDRTGQESSPIPAGRWFVCPVCDVEWSGPSLWRALRDALSGRLGTRP